MKTVLVPTKEAFLELEYLSSGEKFFVRLGTHDPMIVDEMFRRKAYAHKLQIRRKDTVMDIGGHIGTFAVWAAKRGAFVFSYEPDRENYKLLVKNAAINDCYGNVRARNVALVGPEQAGQVDFYVNEKGATSAGSMYVKRGREKIQVPAMDINDAMIIAKPNVIKMDCEGAESVLLPAIEDWSGIRELVLEYHVSMLKDQDLTRYFSLLDLLDGLFPVVEAKRHHSGDWVRFIYARREA